MVEDSLPVIKTDKNGIIETIRSYLNDTRQWIGRSIDKTVDGYYLSGYTQGIWDLFLLKIDEEMNYSWSQTYGGASGDVCYKMKSTVIMEVVF